MRRRKKYTTPPPTPDGMVWDYGRLVPMRWMEEECESYMSTFDKYGRRDPQHYSNDPSYNWVKEKNGREKP